MLDHEQACPYCHHYIGERCGMYGNTSWVNRRGGCAALQDRDLPPNWLTARGRVGQQKQKHQDRAYTSKNDRRLKFVDRY